LIKFARRFLTKECVSPINNMLKRLLFFILLLCVGFVAHAQSPSADSVYSQYLDFNLARFQGAQDKVLELGENIIPNANKLPEKTRINFYFAAGKMYEDDNQPDKALPFYEKVALAVPDYYVAHRALGYLYLDKAKVIEDRMNSATDKTTKDSLLAQFVIAARKALPHLEKAQACDPSDETLEIIKSLYNKINDPVNLNSLTQRLKLLGKNCLDILSEN
jgi:tetratricopeptide (TPR) repeat protein